MKTLESRPIQANPLVFAIALGTGGLLSLMVHLNGELAQFGNPLFSSWVAHGTGTVAALVLLAVFYRIARKSGMNPPAPFWAYLGGISGAATVSLSSLTVNSPVGLPGTLALGLAGQLAFSFSADKWGLFGLPKRPLAGRDFVALALVLSGSTLIIFSSSI
ncbi:DMT family transporter [Pararhizobium sp. DWP1-1-3]|uniref:DMT family transporter n=1 Tax=Pararhizobium sp. DWP1-1-3 TaxID=2804652 RepID=UPI003CEA0E01